MIRTFSFASLVLFLCITSAAAPVAAVEDSKESAIEAVTSMVEAGLSEDVIIAWLDTSTEPIPRPSADQLIALKKAGATEALLKRLLTDSKTTAEFRPPMDPPSGVEEQESAAGASELGPRAPSETSDVAAAEPPMEIDASAKLPSVTAPLAETAPSAPPSPSQADREVMVNFTFSYAPWYLNQQSNDPVDDYWDFFVYLDGIPLSYVPPGSVAGITSNLEFSQLLSPGKHIVRVTLERHQRSKGDNWTHRAMVAEEAFPIEVAADGPEGFLTVRFKETWAGVGRGGPLEFTFQQGDTVTELDGVGGNPESWPLICEEVEANLGPGQSPGRDVQRELDSCLSWDGLWEGVWAPPRDEVREALAMFEFRPVPKGS